ncbi:2-oxoacid:ferredoxin oxidoreductase subunit beta [Streptomyces sp. KL116D]|uniref:2-oxoacid:ferredoxin oxidoreductase subunit beta n=1 Tax=Streptomyces sp. KL116D TaxID=3045152 RepID=UPI0035591259
MKDFKSDQEVRWCPGCGDYAILAAVQGFMPELGLAKENIVFVSGIGCSSRFPYYMNTYGMHSIHGRAPAIATGLASSRRDLSVWVVTGDGDALSIGGNHLIHALRRNVNLKILLFNNRIYGLTKGQYSPPPKSARSPNRPRWAPSTPPFNPVSLAIGANASFVARTVDSDRKHLTEGAAPGSGPTQAPRSSRSTRTATSSTTAPSRSSATSSRPRTPSSAWNTGSRSPSAPGRVEGVVRDARTGELEVVAVTEDNRARLVVHDAHAASPDHGLRPLPPRRPHGTWRNEPPPHPHRRLPRRSTPPSTTPRWPTSSTPPSNSTAGATSVPSSPGSDTWTVVGCRRHPLPHEEPRTRGCARGLSCLGHASGMSLLARISVSLLMIHTMRS